MTGTKRPAWRGFCAFWAGASAGRIARAPEEAVERADVGLPAWRAFLPAQPASPQGVPQLPADLRAMPEAMLVGRPRGQDPQRLAPRLRAAAAPDPEPPGGVRTHHLGE